MTRIEKEFLQLWADTLSSLPLDQWGSVMLAIGFLHAQNQMVFVPMRENVSWLN